MNKLKFFTIVALSILLGHYKCNAGMAGNFYNDEPIKLIDMPVGGSLDTKDFSSRNFFFGDGSLLTELYYSPVDDLDVGVALTINNFLGDREITSQGVPGFHLSYRILDETKTLPAIKIGFDNQGRGRWDRANERHEIAAPGAYLALSKQFEWYLGGLSLHSGAGYSVSNTFNDEGALIWFGVETAVWNYFTIAGEYLYQFGENDYTTLYDKGVLSISASASISSQITIGLALRNVLYSTLPYAVDDRALIVEFRL